jgi:hypothetical protein
LNLLNVFTTKSNNLKTLAYSLIKFPVSTIAMMKIFVNLIAKYV